MASDPIIAEELAEHLYDFTYCDVARVESELAVHPDPYGRLFLVRDGQASARLAGAPRTRF